MSSIITFIFSVINTVLRGCVIKVFWGLFIQSQFSAAPNISVAGAIGLSLFVEVLMPHQRLTEEDMGDTFYRDLVSCFYYFLGLLFVLGFGFIVHCFM